MKANLILVGIVGVVVFLMYGGAKYLRRNYQVLSQPGNFADEAEPVQRERAGIVDMQAVMETMRPDTIMPRHRVRYMVTFEFADGVRKVLEVEQDFYDGLAKSQTGVLVTQNGRVLDFIRE